ncbi:MAG: DUF378 domain-containing protein [Rhodobacteraceae bacterium]|nr:DUF378 domain-containing protein [Paracoccaceae bacterium]
MRSLNLITLILIIIGGLNWLLIGLAGTDLVASLFGGPIAPLSRLVYVLVGLSAIWQLVRLLTAPDLPRSMGPRV